MMGVIESIGHDRFPRQGDLLNKRVVVIFRYDGSHEISGVCVRDDYEDPWETIFKLDNGRYVLATECQYRPA